MDIAAARFCFPGLRDKIFLDTACVGLLSVQAQEAMHRLEANLLACPAHDATAHHYSLDQTRQQPEREAARLIKAKPEDIALVESTTQGLEAIAAAIPLAPGHKILVGDIEFMGLAVPWVPRQQWQGVQIQVIPNREGRLCVEDYAKALDERTRMILLSSVLWNNGYRVDLAAFCELARKHEVILVVDAIQQLGAVRLDVSKTPVDFLVCGGHKWLNAPVGRGFLYVNPRIRERFDSPWWGYLHITEPKEGWAKYFADPATPAVRDYDFVPTARRYEVGGTSNYLGNVALGAALALVNELGGPTIERHIFGLTDLLIDRLRAAGATIVSPSEASARSGITTFTMGQGVEADAALLQALLEKRILVSQRYTGGVGGLRVSTHFFNNADDIKQLAKAVAAFKKRK
jgi:selenocysteine lyase/cysteine desulfurase